MRRHRSLGCVHALLIVMIVSTGTVTVARASSTTVALPDGKSYKVKVKRGMPVQFKSGEVEVSDLALGAAADLKGESQLPFAWIIFAQVLAQGSFVVKATTPLDESVSTSFDFTGPGKLTQRLFDCASYPKVCAGLDRPGTHWFLLHLSFEPQGGGKVFEVDQWARTDQLEIEAVKRMVAQAKKEYGATAAPDVALNPKATVYVYRHRGFVGCGMKFPVWCDEVLLARISCGRYFIAEIDPGPHTFRSDIPTSTVALEFEAGKTYFLRADIASEGVIARGGLYAMDGRQGSLAVQSLIPLPREKILDDQMVLPQ